MPIRAERFVLGAAMALVSCVGEEHPDVWHSGVVQCRRPARRQERPYETTVLGDMWARVEGHRTDDWDFLQGGRGVSVDDFDGDGVFDLLVPRDGFPTRMFRGQGDGTFVDMTRHASPTRSINACSIPPVRTSTAMETSTS